MASVQRNIGVKRFFISFAWPTPFVYAVFHASIINKMLHYCKQGKIPKSTARLMGSMGSIGVMGRMGILLLIS
jgi:hypothetical protein